MESILELDPALFIGKGKHREVYAHPGDQSLCVKIVRDGFLKESLREQSYYRVLQKRNISWQVLPRFHGSVNTNLGEGAVFDLVRDFDGAVSKTLEHYLSSALDAALTASLESALQVLKARMLEEVIIPMGLKSRNILYQRSSCEQAELVIVDDIGCSEVLPLALYFKSLARRKILRKWQRFETELLRDYKISTTSFER